MNGPYHNMYQMSANGGVPGGPLLHSLHIPRESCEMSSMMSPAESIASTLVSPSDTYASSVSSSSTQCGPFTPDDALRMMSLSMPPPKDVPENVDGDGDASEIPMSYNFWPSTDALWANMESLMNEDFNLGAIPPVELGFAQFEAITQQTTCSSSSSSSSSTIHPDGGECDRDEYERNEYERDKYLPEEHDFHVHDATPGLDSYSGVFAHDSSMNW